MDTYDAVFTRAGFLHFDWPLPSGTSYEVGDLYVLVGRGGFLRAYCPPNRRTMELSTGSLYEPIVHYHGPVPDTATLLRLVEQYRP